MKMIVVFSIRDRLKYIGHLDLMRAMQRALRIDLKGSLLFCLAYISSAAWQSPRNSSGV